ncbi:MAG: alpha/beta hydrolase [Chitinophagales bacterium]|nr:alpha/beta hydrolase [Chitinophagales bacterium]
MKTLFFMFCLSLTCMYGYAQSLESRLEIEGEETFSNQSGKKIKGEVGRFKVPENRSNPNSEDIYIHFVRLKSTNANQQVPLFYLEGGPGSSCTWQAENPRYMEVWSKFLELGDVILLDQRGTGAGRERVLYIWQDDLPEDVLADEDVLHKHFKAVEQRALTEFEERGVDLEGYTSIENAKDIDELRQALGYSDISLLGFSYGTHLGQTYIKYHGEHVENAILVGVEGLNHTFKLPSAMDVQFQKIALLSNADPGVSTEVPDFMALYHRVIQKLEKEPVRIKVRSPLTRQPMEFKIGAYTLNMLIRYDIGDASDIPVFPRFLYSIDQGDYSILRWFVQKRINNLYGISGMATTMDAASGATPVRWQRIKEEEEQAIFKNIVNFNLSKDWPTPDLGANFRAPLITDVRTLFMSGTLDFNTPPYQAEEVRWGFSNSSHIIVNNAGHEQIMTHPQAADTMIRFLKGENIDNVALSRPKLEFIPVTGKVGEVSHPSVE